MTLPAGTIDIAGIKTEFASGSNSLSALGDLALSRTAGTAISMSEFRSLSNIRVRTNATTSSNQSGPCIHSQSFASVAGSAPGYSGLFLMSWRNDAHSFLANCPTSPSPKVCRFTVVTQAGGGSLPVGSVNKSVSWSYSYAPNYQTSPGNVGWSGTVVGYILDLNITI